MNRSIGVSILLTIVTCGIYGLYWIYCITETACQINPREWQTSGGITILLSIVTCGIYSIFWAYKMGKAYMAINGGADNSILYLILSIIGFNIINCALIQNDINNAYPQ